MNEKHLNLIKYMMEANGQVTAAELAGAMQVSVRSVKNYIYDLNREYDHMITSSHKGYGIQVEVAVNAIQSSMSKLPQTHKERVNYIIGKIIKSSEPVDRLDLCDELFISTTTMQSTMVRVKKKLETYGLSLEVNQNKLTVAGNERDKRRILGDILYSETDSNFVDLDSLQNMFPEYDIDYIRDEIIRILRGKRYFINDYSLMNLILHLVITLERLQHEKGTVILDEGEVIIEERERETARELADSMETVYPVQFSVHEVDELALLIFSRVSKADDTRFEWNDITELVGESCFIVVQKLVDELKNEYGIEFGDQELLVRFSLHINNLMKRARRSSFSKNPLKEEIRQSCPLLYDVSVRLAGIIKEHTGTLINDDEIAYIAYHIGFIMELKKIAARRLSVILYCPIYYDVNTRLYEFVNNKYQEDLLITSIITDERELQEIAKPDLIISTVKINTFTEIPCVIVKPFFLEESQTFIQTKIQEIKREKKRQQFARQVQGIIRADLFEVNAGFGNSDEVIHYLCEKLKKCGLVDAQFEDHVRERESLASTAYPSFAIPHAMKCIARDNAIAVLINRTPVCWGEQKVELVLMFCFGKSNREMFNEVFETITIALIDSNVVKKAILCRDYNEFIDLLVASI